MQSIIFYIIASNLYATFLYHVVSGDFLSLLGTLLCIKLDVHIYYRKEETHMSIPLPVLA